MSDQETLKPKHRAFVEAYLRLWNATEAYLVAYPKASRATAGRNGSILLKNTDIAAAISARLKEMALDADEVLARLSDQATANVAAFFCYAPDGRVTGVNTEALQKRGHLVKKIKVDPEKIEIELYDGQNALVQLGRYHGLFTDKHDLTNAGQPFDLSAWVDVRRERLDGVAGLPEDTAAQETEG